MVDRDLGLAGWWRSRPTRVQDAVLAALTFVGCSLLIVAGLGPVTGSGDERPWLRLLLVATLCGLQSQRRSHPTAALALALIPVAVDASTGATLPVLLVLTDLVYAGTLYSAPSRTPMVSRSVLIVSAVLVIVTGLLSADLRYTVFAALVAAGFLISPMLTGHVVRQHRDSAAWQREKAEADRRVADLRHRTALAAERTRMARELHDVISGHLSAIALQTEALLRHERSGTRPSAGTASALESVRGQSVQALAAMRSMIDMLRREDSESGGDLAELPVSLPGALDELRAMVESTGAPLQLTIVPRPLPELPAGVELAAYRVAAEAIGNAVKHAPGCAVDVSVTAQEHELTVLVCNDIALDAAGDTAGDIAVGSAVDPARGHGLANMLHRVTAVGGAFSAGPVAAGREPSSPRRWSVSARFVLSPSLFATPR